MNPLATIVATAAATAASLKLVQSLKKRLKEAPENVRWLKKHRSAREDGAVLDLEPDTKTGVYGLKEDR